MSQEHERRMSAGHRSMLLMTAFVVSWAVIELFAAETLAECSPYQIVFVRYVVHLLLMAALWGWREPSSLWRTSRLGYQIARSLLMVGMPVSWILALQHGVDARTLMSIFWLSPLLVLLFAALGLRERAPPVLWLAAAAAFAGALLAIGRGDPSLSPAWLLPLAMAICFSLYIVMTRSLRGERSRTNLFYTAAGVAAALAPFMPAVWVTPAPGALAAMVAVGVLGFVELWLLDRLARAAPVSVTATLLYLQIPVTAVLERVVYHRHPGLRALAGLAVIAAASALLWARAPALTVEEPA